MVASLATAVTGPSSRERDVNFASRMALVMLAANLIGFGPTLYLRPLFDVPPMPIYLFLHGAFGTAWFALAAIQPRLIQRRSVQLHRRLGLLGAAIAFAVLLSGIYTSWNMVPRNIAIGRTSAAEIALFESVTTADITAFIVFPSLVIAAIVLRHRFDIHWRAMSMASICILGPAFARIASWLAPFPNAIPGVLLLAVIATVGVYDMRTRGRLHAATIIGSTLIVGLFLILQAIGIGPAIVAAKLSA